MIVAGLALAILLAPMPVQAADTTPSRVEEPSFDPVTEGHAFRLKLPEGGHLADERSSISISIRSLSMGGLCWTSMRVLPLTFRNGSKTVERPGVR